MKRMGIALIGTVLLGIGCAKEQPVRILKLAHALDTEHPVHRGMVFMAKRVQELSEGRMRVDIYPGGQLGDERALVELLQIGSLSMTKVSTAPLETFVPEMKILGMPYLFRDNGHRWKVLNGNIGRKILLSGERVFLRGLCFYDAGCRSFYTQKKPIQAPSDLKGLKIRVMPSITSVQMIQSLGGSSTPIAWGELYTALQQGVVDGAENNPPSFYFSRHYEVCKYYSLDEHTSVPDILLMSTVVWKSLSAQEQAWLEQAVRESVIEQRRLWEESEAYALAEVRKAGVEIARPDKEPFRQAVRPMMDDYKRTTFADIIDAIAETR